MSLPIDSRFLFKGNIKPMAQVVCVPWALRCFVIIPKHLSYEGLGKRRKSTTVHQIVNMTKVANKTQGAGRLSSLIGLRLAIKVK